MKKILIAVPTARYIEPATFKSIYDLEIPQGFAAEFNYFDSYQLDLTRTRISNNCRDYDYLFSVDSDIIFDKDALSKLLASDKDIVTGIYAKKRLDTTEYEIYKKIEGRYKSYTEINTDQLFEIDACGFGCVLVRTGVFSKIDYPPFRNTWVDSDALKLSEDLYFCKKVKRSGFSIWANPAVICGHLGLHQFK